MPETKEKIFEKTLELVSRHGIRMMSMDSLAREMGVSKKTIYHFYSNKEALIVDCVAYIISGLKVKLEPVIKSGENPVLKIAEIYACCLKVILQFPGAFFHDLKKLHPQANSLLLDFRQNVVFANIKGFLKEAKARGFLLPDTTTDVVCEIHFFRILELVDNFSLRASLKPEEILRTLIVTNLRGLLKYQHIGLLDSYYPMPG